MTHVSGRVVNGNDTSDMAAGVWVGEGKSGCGEHPFDETIFEESNFLAIQISKITLKPNKASDRYQGSVPGPCLAHGRQKGISRRHVVGQQVDIETRERRNENKNYALDEFLVFL
jgi:hypothetical protein